VDIGDASAARYLYPHKHQRWTKATLIYIFKMTVVNAWLNYRLHKPKIDQRGFIEALIRESLMYSK